MYHLLHLIFLSLVLGPPCFANSSADSKLPSVLSAGIGFQQLLPSRLPEFSTTLFVYGPILEMIIPGGALHLQGSYGHGDTTLLVGEFGYRLDLRNPYIAPFLLAGIHYLSYGRFGGHQEFFGANVALGFRQRVYDQIDINALLKLYFQQRMMVSFGAGFLFRI